MSILSTYPSLYVILVLTPSLVAFIGVMVMPSKLELTISLANAEAGIHKEIKIAMRIFLIS